MHVLATYSVPPAADSSRHHLLNVATLVGPRKGSHPHPDESPNIVFTTTKHHPVPFVESYSHAVRALPELGSVAEALPLARIALPHLGHHTPSPHLTPPQTLTVSAVICQDAAYPGLTSSLAAVDDGVVDYLQAAQLLLNPSATPASLTGLGALSLAQARARAIEHGAFLLRCDAPARHAAAAAGTGSVLIDPSGLVRVWTGFGQTDSGIWDAAIRPEEASNDEGRSTTTIWTRIGGTNAHATFGAESRFLLLVAAMTLLVRIIEGGEARRRLLDTEWRDIFSRIRERARDGWRRARWSTSHGGSAGSAPNRLEGARGQGQEEQERLIEVD